MAFLDDQSALYTVGFQLLKRTVSFKYFALCPELTINFVYVELEGKFQFEYQSCLFKARVIRIATVGSSNGEIICKHQPKATSTRRRL